MGWYYMANIKEKIYAEMENITKVLIELEKVKDRPNKELVVLVGKGFIESGC
jgi:chaperonin cofactor prefoldin